MRDLSGFLDTRYRLLQLRPGNRNNWIGFCAGHYLNQNYEVAVQVLNSYESTLDEIPKEEAYEHSEFLMFKVKILEDMEKHQEALELLHNSTMLIKDRIAYLETEARIYKKLNKTEEACEKYRSLLEIIPDNADYHRGLQQVLGVDHESTSPVSEETQEILDSFYEDFQTRHPRCLTARRISLDYLQGAEFIKSADDYIRNFLDKGIPSLFSDLKPLYNYPEKVDALFEIFDNYINKMNHQQESNEALGNPQSALWVHHYLAQHFDSIGQTERALQHIQLALEHTPTVAEVHVVHSKILKHAGDLPGAFEAADQGRKLDLADRYLNCIAVKAAFRAGLITEADELAALFTKDADQISSLVEMQCLWYEIACGNAQLQKKNFGKALKKFVGVSKHFEDFVEDQFDFHGYCVRKMTLRAYIDMLYMEDKIYNEMSYSKAAIGAIKCYLALYDDKELILNPNQGPGEKSGEKGVKGKKTNAHKKGQPPPPKADPDPDGVKLASVDDPLMEATKFVTMLRSHGADRLESQQMGFEVYLRKQKMLLALSCVQRAIKISGRSHPTVHSMIIQLCKTVEDLESTMEDSPASTVLKEGINELLGDTCSVLEYNNNYFNKESVSGVIHRAVGIEMLIYLDPEHKTQHLSVLMEGTGPLGGGFGEDMLTLKDCQIVHQMILNPILNSEKVAEEWKQRCARIFKRSSYFHGADTTTGSSQNGITTTECDS
eukprot:g6378.t1